MTPKTKTYIALSVAGPILCVAAFTSVYVRQSEKRFERSADTAIKLAAKAEAAARDSEMRASEYKHKIEYLEASLSELRLIAIKQNEELKQMQNNSDSARHDVGRARGVRSVESTNVELCAKLAALGHPCE